MDDLSRFELRYLVTWHDANTCSYRYQYLTNFVAWLPSTPTKFGALFIESFSKVFGVTWWFACLLKPLLSLHNCKGSFEISAFGFRSLFQKLWTKCLINMCCKNAHVSTIINFTLKLAVIFSLKYLYLRGNSKKHKVSFPGRFLPRNEKILVYGLKNRGSTYTRDRLILG